MMFCCNKNSVDTVSLLHSSTSSIHPQSPVSGERPTLNNTTVSESANSNQAHPPPNETTHPNCVQPDETTPPKQDSATSSQTPVLGEHQTVNDTTVSEPANTQNNSSNQAHPPPDATTLPKQDSTTSSQTPPPVSDEHLTRNDTTVSEPSNTQNNSSFKDKLKDVQNNSSNKDKPASSNLVFKCKLAHCGPRRTISGFTEVKTLYQKIANCFDVDPKDILFCTLNTHRVDMSKLLGQQVFVTDIIFAHIRGQPKEVEVTKPESALGLTFTDNGAGNVFVKKIEEGSFISKVPLIEVGDAIEKLGDHSMINCKHIDVARVLKEIPTGTTFLMHLIAPKKGSTSTEESKRDQPSASESDFDDTSEDKTATQKESSKEQTVVTQSQMNKMENEIMEKTTDLIDKLEKRVLDLEERNDTLQKEIGSYKKHINKQDE